jgi:formylglycine-generating enzyme required for sulfatase activity
VTWLLLTLVAQAVLIPEGTFEMGRSKLTADDKTKMRPHVLLDDRPVHRVKISAFRLDAREVTQGEYAAFVQATRRPAPYHWLSHQPPAGREKISAYNVTWEDARAYCAWKNGRLPTEAEWERAARGGIENQSYPWGDKFEAKRARSGMNEPGAPGQFEPNAFGLYDMAGGMAEWTNDWFDREYYASSPAENPPGPAQGTYKVIRGGAWSDPASRVTVFFRNWVRPVMRQPNIGFRCAYPAEGSNFQGGGAMPLPRK